MSKILTRIQAIAINEGITIGALERSIGASKGVLSRAINNGTDIQSKWLQILVDNYPQYSTEWLLTGKEPMLKENIKSNSEILIKKIEDNSKDGIPLIPLDAVAGFPATDSTCAYIESCDRYIIPEFQNKGADFLIRVSGDSMTPLYYSGDLIACHKIKDIRFFQWGTVYVLETSQGVLVKRVMESIEHNDCILCASENGTIHRPFLLPKDDIRSMSTIVGLIRIV